MVNHFRTLLLNKAKVVNSDISFGQYISNDFTPIPFEGPEESFHAALFGSNITSGNLLWDITLEGSNLTLEGSELVDEEIIFAGNRSRQEFIATMLFRLMGDFDSTREIMDEIDTRLTFDPGDAMLTRIPDENRPVVPKISQIWQKISNLGSFRTLFASSGPFSETLADLSRLMDTLKRDDHRVAVTCCAYCLRLTERIQ